jgi:hypothetical protein
MQGRAWPSKNRESVLGIESVSLFGPFYISLKVFHNLDPYMFLWKCVTIWTHLCFFKSVSLFGPIYIYLKVFHNLDPFKFMSVPWVRIGNKARLTSYLCHAGETLRNSHINENKWKNYNVDFKWQKMKFRASLIWLIAISSHFLLDAKIE